jgi:CRP-like cAMP-binding protein
MVHPAFTKHWLIRDLSPTAAATLYALGDVVDVTTDQVLIEADTKNDHLFLLLEGAFKVYLPDGPGRKGGVTLGHRGPGDLLGEYSFIDAFQPIARVTASTPGSVLRIPHGELRRQLEVDVETSAIVYRNMLAYLVARLRAQDEEIDSLMF